MSSGGSCNCAGAVSALQSDVRSIKSEIDRINQEMANIASEIRSMATELSGELRRVHGAVENSNEKLVGILGASGGILVATGLTAKNVSSLDQHTQENLETLQELQQRQTSAMTQLDSIRTYTEAVALTKKSDAFCKEIDQRFSKAVEGVVLNRILYDKHFRSIDEDYDSKIRTIGSHIYQIWEEDLHPIEEASHIPTAQRQELAVEVDLHRLAARSSLLDSDLEMVRREHLDPLIALDATFERALDLEYAIDGNPDEGREILVPAAVAFLGDRVEIAVDTRIAPSSDGGFSFIQERQLPEHFAYCHSVEGNLRIQQQCKIRPMTPEEVLELKGALASIASRGLIDPQLLPAFGEYLEKVPLGIVDGAVGQLEVQHA